jgi:hypothetical protein
MSFLLKGKKIFLFVFLLFILFSPAQDVFSQSPSTFSTPTTGGQESATFRGGVAEEISAGTTNEAGDDLTDVNWKDKVLNALGGLLDGLFKALIPVFEVIALAALTIASFLLGIASYIFDIFVQIGVYGISDIVGQDENSPVKKAWLIFRNIANIGLIFVVISIAIGTILQSSGYEGKKLLGRVIVAALLMNFSFFLGAIVVDISNEMALTVYKEIKKETDAGENQSANLGTFMYENSGVAVIIAAGRDTVSENEEKTFEKTVKSTKWEVIKQHAANFPNTLQDPKSDEADKMVFNVTSLVAGAVAALVLAVVLLIAGFAILGRLIAILLLLVVSPIAFMSMILPKTQKISDDWWKSIIGHSFYLPAFLLFIYVGIKILKSFQEMDMSKYIEGINSNSDSVASYIGTIKVMTIAGFAMGITIGLFIAALIVAKKISDGGSAAVGKISAAVTSGVGGAAMAGGAFMARNTVGRGANAFANEFAKGKFATTKAGMFMLGGMKGVAKAGFDARGSSVFKGVASATGVGGDFNNNFKTGSDGFTGQLKRATDARVTRAGYLSSDKTKAQVDEQKRLQDQMQNTIDTDANVAATKNRISDLKTDLEAETATGNKTAMKALKTSITASERQLKIEEDRVKAADDYVALQKQNDGIMSRQRQYGTNLEAAGKASIWIPFNARAANAGAAKRILKEKSENDKLIDAIKASNK